MVRICKIEGCERKQFGYELCNAHYLRWRRHGHALGGRVSYASAGTFETCTVEDCEKSHWAHGLCVAHYTRKRRGQDFRTISSRQRVKELPVDEIVRLYAVEHYSTVRLAKRFDVADVTISALLRKHAITIR